MWKPPQRFDEYELQHRLGGGAMGHVYVAHDTLLDRDIAIKFVLAVDDALARARFLVEARAIARLQHPNIVTIHRVGEVLGQLYIVSELVRGRTLDKLAMPVAHDLLVRIALDLARGLSAAHRHGVLHRDLKPANAVLGDDGVTKLLDFGVAKLEQPARTEDAARRPLDHAALDALFAAETVPPKQAPRPAPALDGELTDEGLVGTPLYMAPECWHREPITARSDLYSLGALLFHLATGRPPHDGGTIAQIAQLATTTAAPPVRSRCEIDPRLALVVDRCLRPDAAERYESADAVCAALTELAVRRAAQPPTGNPYRGLRAFHAEHRDVFFGRAVEVQAIVERLRVEPMVVIAGDSGVGKSSLALAGVAPAVVDGALGGTDRWTAVVVVLGRRPLVALGDALARHLGSDEAALLERLENEPTNVSRDIGRQREERGGMLLVLDQLEELVDASSPEEADRVAELLARLAGPWPGFRVLATLRSDRLTRVSALRGFRDSLTRGLYLLAPLDERATREAIVEPARLSGARFESDAMVDVLVEAGRAPASLPLLQFTLARLWDARDGERGIIPAKALDDLGGVAGALAGHADAVIAGLLPEDRPIAREILIRLVSSTGARRRRTHAELAGDGEIPKRVLEALVAGRLIAAEEGSYTLAHDALVHGWATLADWLEADAHLEAVRDRVEHAASEWLRIDGPDDLLWSARRLQETEDLRPGALSSTAARFLAASRGAIRRRRLKRRAVGAAAVLALAGTWVGWRMVVEHRLDRAVADAIARADAVLAPALELDRANQRERDAAFAAFDAGRRDDGETQWSRALALAARAEEGLQAAARVLEDAVALDPSRESPRARLADVLFARALLAERMHRRELVGELLDRLERVDHGGAERRGWIAPARIELQLVPAEAKITVERYVVDGGTRRAVPQPASPTTTLSLPPGGSYRLTLSAPGHADVRVPLVTRRGDRQTIRIALPRALPPGFAYVAAGEVYTGSSADESLRKLFLDAAPIHRRHVDAFLIARHETTFAEWIEFLETLDDAERAQRLPRAGIWGAVALTRLAPGRYQLAMTPNDIELRAETGQRLVYPGRQGARREQDWMRLPVTGISLADAEAYASWLERTGRVRGARVCTELEWQRAARGADDRLYPHGDELAAGDANFMLTYGENPGPDEVGSFSASESPFGARDMVGNVWELTRNDADPRVVAARGGGAMHLALEARIDNRVKAGDANFRGLWAGVRLCATVSP